MWEEASGEGVCQLNGLCAQMVAAVVERSMDQLERLVDDKQLLRTKFRRGVRKARSRTIRANHSNIPTNQLHPLIFRIYGNELNRKSYWSIKAQYQRYGS